MELFKVHLGNGSQKVDVSLNSENDRSQTPVFEIRSDEHRLGRYKNLGPALTKFYAQIGRLCVSGWSVDKFVSKEKVKGGSHGTKSG